MKNLLVTTSQFTTGGFPDDFNIIYNPYGRKLTEKEVLDLVKRFQPVGIIAGVEPLTKKVLACANNLKVISRCGIGLDSVDLMAAKEYNIAVVNTPDAPTQAVAELTVGLMLSVLRNIPYVDSLVRGAKTKTRPAYLLGNKTIGIIGCGRIGSAVARICQSFGCSLLGYDPNIQSHPVISLTSFNKLIRLSDIISLHIPLTNQTRNIISEQTIKSMKKNAVLINVSRGGLIDEDALYDSLTRKHLYGAALDCFEEEPYTGPLVNLDNVVLSDHMGSSTEETRAVMEKRALGNLILELQGQGIL